MKFQSLTLSADKSTARTSIMDRVSGIKTREEGERITFYSQSGIKLATLTDTTLPDGRTGSRLRYRTSLISPVASNARRQAKQIRNVVEKYRV